MSIYCVCLVYLVLYLPTVLRMYLPYGTAYIPAQWVNYIALAIVPPWAAWLQAPKSVFWKSHEAPNRHPMIRVYGMFVWCKSMECAQQIIHPFGHKMVKVRMDRARNIQAEPDQNSVYIHTNTRIAYIFIQYALVWNVYRLYKAPKHYTNTLILDRKQ